jgi:hypothetical protein
MQETAKALVSENKNELPAARTLEVSLDRADNVIEGGTPFHTTSPYALDFPGAASLRFLKGAGLDAASPSPLAELLPRSLLKFLAIGD